MMVSGKDIVLFLGIIISVAVWIMGMMNLKEDRWLFAVVFTFVFLAFVMWMILEVVG